MIKNARQRRSAELEAARLARSSDPDERARAGQLEAAVFAYDELRSTAFSAEVDLSDLSGALLAARVAAGLTQRELAERLGLREQQVQRYEAGGYASASLRRVAAVARALGLRARVSLDAE